MLSHKITIRVETADALCRHIAELIHRADLEKLIRTQEQYARANELYLLYQQRQALLKKILAADVKGTDHFTIKIDRIPLQVLVDNTPLNIGANGFIGEAMKFVTPSYRSIPLLQGNKSEGTGLSGPITNINK